MTSPEPAYQQPDYIVAVHELGDDRIRVEVLRKPPGVAALTDQQLAIVLISAADAVLGGLVDREPGLGPNVTVTRPEDPTGQGAPVRRHG